MHDSPSENCPEGVSPKVNPGLTFYRMLSRSVLHEAGIRAFECDGEGCRVQCFGAKCSLQARCCSVSGELKPVCRSGASSRSSPTLRTNKFISSFKP